MATLPASGTLLVISGPGIADYSARGLTQTLDPVDASAVLARTVNGVLIDLSPAQMRKYKSTIAFSDVETPALDGVWPGITLTVDCVAELGFKTVGGAPGRPVVPDSSRIAGAWTYYRPQLQMRVVTYSTSRDEYGAMTEWSLELEEI
jgi:hypothetical protein